MGEAFKIRNARAKAAAGGAAAGAKEAAAAEEEEEEEEPELSEYERERQENILRNQAFLASLGL